MSTHTYYVALPFKRSKEGHLVAGEAKECACAESATKQAEELSGTAAGVVAFSRMIDPMLGTCKNGRLLRSIGEVPNLSYLLGAA